MVKFKDYYQILGVNRTASQKEIKTAYRSLARKYHPDANQGDKASEEKFKEITEAYEVLKDEDKRKKYDRLGSNWKAGAEFKPPPDFSGFGFDFEKFSDMSRSGPFSDFFEVLFGQTFGSPGRPGTAGATAGGTTGGRPTSAGRFSSARTARPKDQEATIELSVEELANGAHRTLKITPPGSPSKTIEVKIPKGVRSGSKVRIPSQGAETPYGRGDLFLKVKVKPHDKFTIDGDNLFCEAEITPAKAVLGGQTKVPTLDGPVKIRIPAGTQGGKLLRLRGRGLPKLKSTVRGDLLIRVKLVIPESLSKEERELYEKLAELETTNSQAATT